MKMSRRAAVLVFGGAAMLACAIDAEEATPDTESTQALGGAPRFLAPFPCGQSWTYSHHGSEVRQALDFVANGPGTNGSPVLASAAGVATQHSQPGGAGHYIAIDHGGGWTTYYFHLQSFSVGNGVRVEQGKEVGRVGSTGASSGPHLHYEQLLNGVGQTIAIDGRSLGPYPGAYGQRSLTGTNCSSGGTTCPGGTGTVVGLIDVRYRELGGCGSPLGAPLTDERTTPDGYGRYSVFERGSIYWTEALGAHEVQGLIRDRWAELGWEAGVLGYPFSGEQPTPDGVGRFSVFERGSVYWSPPTGAHEVLGVIRDEYAALGWERGALGYPITGEVDIPGGRKSTFQHGSITWKAATNEVAVLMDGAAADAGAGSDGGP